MDCKKYIIYDNYKIGYISNVCTCEKCKERGMSEVFINDLDGKYLDCLKGNEIEDIVYLGESIMDAIDELVNNFQKIIEKKEKENKYLQELINFYAKLKHK